MVMLVLMVVGMMATTLMAAVAVNQQHVSRDRAYTQSLGVAEAGLNQYLWMVASGESCEITTSSSLATGSRSAQADGDALSDFGLERQGHVHHGGDAALRRRLTDHHHGHGHGRCPGGVAADDHGHHRAAVHSASTCCW